MHWYYYEHKYPETFRDFEKWMHEKYPAEPGAHARREYQTNRLCEYCAAKGYKVEITGDVHGSWEVSVNGNFLSRYQSQTDAIMTGLYNASEAIEMSLSAAKAE